MATKDKSGEHATPMEVNVALLAQSVHSMTSIVNTTNTKLDNVLEQLQQGNDRFKDIEHNQVLVDLRVKAIEAAHSQSANTKQSIVMMLVDKGIGVLLPWSAIAYMIWGK